MGGGRSECTPHNSQREEVTRHQHVHTRLMTSKGSADMVVYCTSHRLRYHCRASVAIWAQVLAVFRTRLPLPGRKTVYWGFLSWPAAPSSPWGLEPVWLDASPLGVPLLRRFEASGPSCWVSPPRARARAGRVTSARREARTRACSTRVCPLVRWVVSRA